MTWIPSVTKLLLSLFLFIIFLAFNVHSELIRQCTCDEIEQCRQRLLNYAKPCADRCQRYVHKLTADYQSLKNCVLQNEPQIIQTVNCTQNFFHNACARQSGRQVQKRYMESLEIEGLKQLNRELGDMAQKLQPMIGIGKRFLRCARDCINRSSRYCYEYLDCGLDLPSDSVMIQNAKQCATSSGLNTAAVQQMCFCAVSAGVRDLQDVCSHLKIS